ncbi:Aldo/keto reductase family protein, partial [Emiliania huxleyi CCMP1516]|uniref:NADP-dependent oxidoreductase domain-containing protein n=3 Tax=Emiliania huxleyi TaxID=2903 RepID=A0A0D3JNU1_EMIH1
MKLLRIFCLYPCALAFALAAILIGFFSQAHIPEGRAFATIIPLAGGYLPATIVGDSWWEDRTPTPRVPANLMPAARPSGEKFVPLLGTQDNFPMLGLGLCCRATAYDFHSVSRSVLWYLLKGGRHLDAAYLYMNNEAIGHAIAAAADRGVPRSELFVTSKLGPRFFSGLSPEVELKLMLQQLGLDYLDLVLLHHPEGIGGMIGKCANGTAAECRANAWVKLSALRAQGLIRNLGVSNFQISQIQPLEALGLAPVSVNQVQYNPWAPDWQQDVVDYCQKKGIVVTAWSPFQGTMMQHASLFTVQSLQEVARAKGKTVAQVMLRWALQKGVVAIPGTSNPAHMDENLAAYSFELTAGEMAVIDGVRSDPKAKGFVAIGFEKNDS